MQKQRVLIIFNHPAPYKVKQFNEIAKFVDLTVIFERTQAKDRPSNFYSVNEYNFKTIFFHKGYFKNENTFSNELVNYLKDNYSSFDKIIFNGYSNISELKAIHYLNKKKVPFGLMINGGVIHKDFFVKYYVKKKFISSASWYLSPNEQSNGYLAKYGADITKIHMYPYSSFYLSEVIKNPLANNEINQILDKYHIQNGDIFICPNQFIKRKNNIRLIEIFKNRKETLLLIGKGPLKEKYQKYIKNNNIQNVHILDPIPHRDLMELYSACTATISLSNEDIFGHTILEGFARGLPAIASNKIVSGISFIKEGVNGFLVDPNDDGKINQAINDVKNIKFGDCIKVAQTNCLDESAKKIVEALK